MRLPFDAWGASVVLTGHQHVYEWIERPGKVLWMGAGARGNLSYVINGLGGHPWVYELHNCRSGWRREEDGPTEPFSFCRERTQGSTARYNAAHGAMVFQVDEASLRFCFYSIADGGSLVDHHEVSSRPGLAD
jgi:hypothetical protein